MTGQVIKYFPPGAVQLVQPMLSCVGVLHRNEGEKAMTVNVLGTKYTIKESNKVMDQTLENCDGYCDASIKVIVIDSFKEFTGSKKDLESYKKQVIRHELVHAFLFESGLDGCSWAKDEEIVDWIACQFPKLQNAFAQCNAI